MEGASVLIGCHPAIKVLAQQEQVREKHVSKNRNRQLGGLKCFEVLCVTAACGRAAQAHLAPKVET
eukprot:1157471-Pelagomonas_calceolata.AAC.13